MDGSRQSCFMWAVQALAQPANVQIGLFPEFVEVADELTLEHEETQELFLGSVEGASITASQRRVIEALDHRLETMSGPENGALWTVEALRTAPEWNSMRILARSVLTEMGWVAAAPPTERGAEYAGPP